MVARLYASVSGVFVYARAMAVLLLIWHLGSLWVANPIMLPSPIASARALLDLLISGEIISNVSVVSA